MPQVSPDILRWARETAGLTREDAARKLAIRDTKTAMAVDRLRAMEDGERPPTRAMLSRMAKQYHRRSWRSTCRNPLRRRTGVGTFAHLRRIGPQGTRQCSTLLFGMSRPVKGSCARPCWTMTTTWHLSGFSDPRPLIHRSRASSPTSATRSDSNRPSFGPPAIRTSVPAFPDARRARWHLCAAPGQSGEPSHRPGCGSFAGIRTTGRFRAVRRGQPQGLGGCTILHVATRTRSSVAPRARGERGRSNGSGRGVLQPGGLELPGAGHRARGAPHGGQKHERISATDGLWRTTD